MKNLMWLTEAVLRDSGTRCGVNPDRDIRLVTARVEHEGDSFLTITLPDYCRAFERGLDSGKLSPSDTPSFRWFRGLPLFLRGFLEQVFDYDGQLRARPSLEAILCIRQICLLHKKVLRECSEKRQAKAVEAYHACENEVKSAAERADEPTRKFLEAFRRVSGIVWTSILGDVPFGDVREDIRPRHGPGTTAERVLGNSKYIFRRWHSRLEEHFPFTEYGVGSLRNLLEEGCPLSNVDFVGPDEEQPVRVVFVPKTQKTPRVIAIEPVCMQYMQQGILQWLVPQIERCSYTAGHVNFTDQRVNKALALANSRTGRLATIDLSEASDRVSSSIVWTMLDSVPLFREHVFACRSTRATLPDGKTIPLSKFASMGSALCFPMEAMVFYLAMVTGRLLQRQLSITPRNVKLMTSEVYVYGDDILVPVDETPSVLMTLELCGLKVNRHKSFWTGKFRESCGTDAYDGQDITPVYARHELPKHRQSVDAIAGWVATANQFYSIGFWHTARVVREHLESILGVLPHLAPETPGLGWLTYSKASNFQRWNRSLMRFECRTWVLAPLKRPDVLSGDAALLKCFGVVGNKILTATDHLLQTVARGKQTLKRRWVAI